MGQGGKILLCEGGSRFINPWERDSKIHLLGGTEREQLWLHHVARQRKNSIERDIIKKEMK